MNGKEDKYQSLRLTPRHYYKMYLTQGRIMYISLESTSSIP